MAVKFVMLTIASLLGKEVEETFYLLTILNQDRTSDHKPISTNMYGKLADFMASQAPV